MNCLLEIKNVQVFRGNTKVFDNLDLELRLGQHTAILGPNGAGKTTLLKLITREISPVVRNQSHIRLFGEERTRIWELRQRLGLVSHEFQNDYRSLATGREVVLSAFFGSVGIHDHHQINDEQLHRADTLMAELRIQDLADRQYLQLSTGQQRRLLLARALVHSPQALIFDEPTNGLDMASSLQMIASMRRLAQSGHTLILVTHHLGEIIPEISRVIFLKAGSITNDGDKHQLLTSENLTNLYGIGIRLEKKADYYQALPGETAEN